MPLTIVLATLFVSLAGFNVWSMLTGRAVPPRSGASWFNTLNAHRAAGCAFIALYVVLCYVMLRRAKRVAGGRVSAFVNDRARVGLTVKARGPYGAFLFDERRHRRVVFVAGGSGIAPMIAMLRYMDDRCIDVPTTLVYCVRSEGDVFFRDELAALQRRRRQFRYVLVLSRPGAAWIGWEGHLRGEILEEEVERPRRSTFFLCGPPAFMEQARALLKEMAIPPTRVLQESFGGAVATKTEQTLSQLGAPTVTLSRSGGQYRTQRP